MSSVTVKPFCKVCQDAGKPESVYTSHFVRVSKEKNAPTKCPTLLAQNCICCKKIGHTVKYCPLKAKEDKKMEYKNKLEFAK